jgi:8-oxo-dGTP pyrophosphatase MutT (NUDIX family)
MREKNLFDKLSTALAMEANQKDSCEEYFSAAVLVPLTWDNDQLSVLFEMRSTHLAWQPGEICFPGGRIEKTDPNPVFTAIRETTEELGIGLEQVQVIGSLGEVFSPIGVRLYPSVGYISDVQHIHANPDEVAEVFTVPLEFLLTAEPIIGQMERCTRPLADFPFDLLPDYSQHWQNRKNYQVLFYKYGEYVIWGLTAHVLHKFLGIYKKMNLK